MRSNSAAPLGVTEITGSETFVHLTHGGDRWVGLVHGVHRLRAGVADCRSGSTRRMSISLTTTGALAAPAAYAMAA